MNWIGCEKRDVISGIILLAFSWRISEKYENNQRGHLVSKPSFEAGIS